MWLHPCCAVTSPPAPCSRLPLQDGDGFAGVYSGSADWEQQGEGSGSQPRAGRGRREGSPSASSEGRGQGEEAPRDDSGSSAFQPGQEVVVKGGSFADFEGKVVAAEGGRLTAELDIFGKVGACCLTAVSFPWRRRGACGSGGLRWGRKLARGLMASHARPSLLPQITTVDLNPSDVAPSGGDA